MIKLESFDLEKKHAGGDLALLAFHGRALGISVVLLWMKI